MGNDLPFLSAIWCFGLVRCTVSFGANAAISKAKTSIMKESETPNCPIRLIIPLTWSSKFRFARCSALSKRLTPSRPLMTGKRSSGSRQAMRGVKITAAFALRPAFFGDGTPGNLSISLASAKRDWSFGFSSRAWRTRSANLFALASHHFRELGAELVRMADR